MKIALPGICVAIALSASLAGAADTGSVLPVHELNLKEIANLSTADYPQAPAPYLHTAAHVDVQALGHGNANDVQRNAGAVSAVYSAVSLPNPGAVGMPAVNAAPPGSSIYDFKHSGDSAQAWATMSADGAPFLFAQAYGSSTATGNASWTAKLTIPAGSPSLYVALRLPSITAGGNLEQNGPSRWQSRLRTDLLLNGALVWSREATRIEVPNGTTGSGDNCSPSFERTVFLNNYEGTFGLDPANYNTAGPAHTIYLALGEFDKGQAVEVTLVVRADSVSPDKCCLKKGELFCSRATTRVEWLSPDGTPPVRFWNGPPTRLLVLP